MDNTYSRTTKNKLKLPAVDLVVTIVRYNIHL